MLTLPKERIKRRQLSLLIAGFSLRLSSLKSFVKAVSLWGFSALYSRNFNQFLNIVLLIVLGVNGPSDFQNKAF